MLTASARHQHGGLRRRSTLPSCDACSQHTWAASRRPTADANHRHNLQGPHRLHLDLGASVLDTCTKGASQQIRWHRDGLRYGHGRGPKDQSDAPPYDAGLAPGDSGRPQAIKKLGKGQRIVLRLPRRTSSSRGIGGANQMASRWAQVRTRPRKDLFACHGGQAHPEA